MARLNVPGAAQNGALALVLLFSAGATAGKASDEYTLGSQDRLRISLTEISSSSGEIRPRLDGEFTVDAAGDVAIPLLGNIKAAGMSASEFATSIASQFQAKVRLVNPPVTAVEIVQHRPFYITGAVEKPGEYPFRPGMRVIHALSVAGGIARGAALGETRFERDMIQANGELNVLRAQRDRLEARRARLEATIGGKDKVEFPARLRLRASEPTVQDVIMREQLVFDQRRKTRALELGNYNEQLSLLRGQMRTLQNQIETQNAQSNSVDRELVQVRKLESRGLAPSARVYALERTALAADSKRKEVQTEMLKVSERVASTEASIRRLQDTDGRELLAELNGVDGELENVIGKLGTAEDLIQQLQIDGAPAASHNEEIEVTYSLLRERDGQLVEEVTAETSPVRPGDVIKVSRRTTGSLLDRTLSSAPAVTGYQ
ncbi:polysaccharide biosynthesis/export family protein [Rhizobium sp. 007]|uniref:polysaccharide biosynthesis/export family protein n=1 Tax=Rhizobium sp. 007 TaxID=2785056 RepID=UPI002485A350|nr:polysaccharide biosynthesis/export family protein [Rhizobium sp. 007]